MSARDSYLTEKATAAMQSAVRKVVADHRRRGRPLAVWEHDRVVMKTPSGAGVVQEGPAQYKAVKSGEEPQPR